MSEKRLLTDGEIALLTEIYGERDYFYQTMIARGNWILPRFGVVSNNIITVGKDIYSNDFSQTAPDWFVHEGAHLVQEQTFGKHLVGGYFRGAFKSPLRSYDYSDEVRKGVPFEKIGTEAQASMIADYFRAVQGKPRRYATLPVEVYQRVIPESFVPSFGRKGNNGSRRDEPSAGASRSEQAPESNRAERAENLFGGSEAVPRPRPKPRANGRPETSDTTNPLRSRVNEVLRQSVSPERIEPESVPAPVPVPRKKPLPERAAFGTGKRTLANPFDLERPQLRQQAAMLERNPVRAKLMILAAGRDANMFGFN